MLLGALFYDLIIPMDSYVTGVRFRDAQVYLRGTFANERSIDCEVGVVTYDNDNNYEVSSINYGGRFDHIGNAIQSALGAESPRQSLDNPIESDRELLMDKDTRVIDRHNGVDRDRKAEHAAHEATRAEIRRLRKEIDIDIPALRVAEDAAKDAV